MASSSQTVASSSKETSDNHLSSWLLFISGPTASGKTSVADFLASKLKSRYVEGDDFHPEANVTKLHQGEPLTDSECRGWLEAVAEYASGYRDEQVERRLIVTCSALKRSHRELLRETCHRAGYSTVHFIHLDAPESELRRREAVRQGQFAKGDLLYSQFEALERPGIDEADVTMISVVPPPAEVYDGVLDAVLRVIGHGDA
ncbi:Carbohydrate kinase, thermoresistant glucokinase [Metarhizium rileyi]|uniref:Gluconokinase n=1 Tax=Metarhizium rileyi (strain RCEF 4871) TaxID=1649241 RepID=A0A167F4V8_METRR|nr:Carbohydrate kinase, thermoresistant glucokinase [Metarhizium rileyi RCEF 4871]